MVTSQTQQNVRRHSLFDPSGILESEIVQRITIVIQNGSGNVRLIVTVKNKTAAHAHIGKIGYQLRDPAGAAHTRGHA